MSQTGNYTPLQLNALSEITQRRGFSINAVSSALQGTWTPGKYTAGTLVSQTVLSRITESIPNIYQMAVDGRISPETYRNLTNISFITCGALANVRSNTFNPSYSGYGSWSGGQLVSQSYPPRDYPQSGTYSYINQTYGTYAYVTGWPGKNSWQKVTDTYVAAVPPASPTAALNEYDSYVSTGFVSLVARQAYYELSSGRFDQYNNIVNTFGLCSGSRTQTNQQIASLVNSKSFLSGNFSNNNDLTTNDISGVNQSFRIWGEDLINTGKAIDLSNIHRFGTPSVLLLTLQKYGAITQAVAMALQYAGLNSQDLNSIFIPTYVPTPTQEKKIYAAFKLISGDDLYSVQSGVTLQLNCRIPTLTTLADLLDPRFLFPNSYAGLTVPQYRADQITSKAYYFIYQNGGVNQQVVSLCGPLLNDLTAVIPTDIAQACAAFSVAMQQVKNIMQIDVQQFALAVIDLELTSQNLPLTNSTTGTPVNIASVDTLISQVGMGSGNSGAFRQCDYFGSASGYPYTDWYRRAYDIITSLPTTALQQIYNNLYLKSLTPPPPPPDPMPDPPPSPFDPVLDADIQSLIDQANAEIQNIFNSNTGQCHELNYIWNQIGTQLTIEQRAIPLAIPLTDTITDSIDQTDFQSFVKDLPRYGLDNGPGENAQTLEGISDLTTLGGQSIVAAMREARNAERLGWAGIPPDNDVSDEIDLCGASATVTLNAAGAIIAVTMTNKSSGYSLANPPRVNIFPYGYGGQLVPVIEADGSISTLAIINSGIGYPYATIKIESPVECQTPDRTGNKTAPTRSTQPTLTQTTFPGPGPFTTFSANPYLPGPIPPLPPPASASPTIDQTIEDVTLCNCDCWNL